MKSLTLLVFVCGSGLLAQNAPADRVVVPSRNSSRPRLVNVSLLSGSITVKTYGGKEIIVEARATDSGRARRRERTESVDGMRRLDLPSVSGLEVEEEDNQVNVRAHPSGNTDLTLSVPVNTSLKLRCTNGGDINVEGVNGEIDANNLNGKVTLTNVSGAVTAHSLNGSVTVSMNRVDAGKPISFSTLNGNIDVTLPADLKANVKLKADNGDIYSDFDIKLDTSNNRKPITEGNKTQDGRFRVRFDRMMYGTINGGGPDAIFNTFNGRISIRKKK
jgi:predicted membrane protein